MLTRLKRPGDDLVGSTTKRLKTLALKEDIHTDNVISRSDPNHGTLTPLSSAPRSLVWVPDSRAIVNTNTMPLPKSWTWIQHTDIPTNKKGNGSAAKSSTYDVRVDAVTMLVLGLLKWWTLLND